MDLVSFEVQLGYQCRLTGNTIVFGAVVYNRVPVVGALLKIFNDEPISTVGLVHDVAAQDLEQDREVPGGLGTGWLRESGFRCREGP